MGMDTIELVMEIEDAFGISIPDEHAEKLCTIGQTAVYVIERLRQMSPVPEASTPAAPPFCATSRAFYRLRRELRSRYGVPRRLVMPSSRIGDLVRKRSDRERWNDVATACGFRAEREGVFRPAFPPEGMTVRRLVYSRHDQGLATGSLYLPDGQVNTRAVWKRLLDIVGEQFGVKVLELKWDTDYINDLNAD
ncbi:acyl carrier protein [Humisphaera borealis]|uniref:Carrier domain-containing protein n=1 Tax=Humisphaera borealis TaxID=2807512 RepID=A0A7M2WSI8_9BACT|nr:hypothetical protein [Humisphaera borealis]QOV87771.1 hypothetical protein IPV69_15935 [Humisphaera borealis]